MKSPEKKIKCRAFEGKAGYTSNILNFTLICCEKSLKKFESEYLSFKIDIKVVTHYQFS